MKYLILLLLVLFSAQYGFSQVYVSKKDAEADIDYFTKTVMEVHADPFLFISRKQYFLQVEQLKAGISDSIELKDFTLQLYRLTALLNDAHCTPAFSQPAFKEDLGKDIFFPYHLVISENSLVVPQTTAKALDLPLGATILSLNGQRSTELLKKLQNTIGGNASFAMDLQEKFLSYFFYLCNVKAPFRIEYADSQGNTSQKLVEKGLKFADALAVTMPQLKSPYRFQVMGDKLGYLDFGSMSGDWKVFDKYLDSCFTLVKAKGIEHVAIDLRSNSGGNSILGEVLLSYVTTKKFTLMGGRRWKISHAYKQYLLARGDSTNEYHKKREGITWKLGNCNAQPPRFKNNNVFEGKVYLLTGPFTFSSANMLADGVKQFNLAEIVGEPTGENTNDFGEAYVFILPQSKLKIQTTTAYDLGADCNKKSQMPVLPDKPVVRTLADRIQEKDRVLEYILEQVK